MLSKPRSSRGPGARWRTAAVLGLTALAGALLGGVFATQVVGESTNAAPEPAGQPVVVPTVPATAAQARGARISAFGSSSARPKAPGRRQGGRVLVYRSRISEQPIVTQEGQGSYVGLKCPAGAKAVSGGVLSQRINLLVSSSSPNDPLSGRFFPNMWFVAVTNVNVDGTGGPLAWQGVVNCLHPVKFQK